ncbi:MAG: hypothetical protein HY330_06300 [Chloroflexi bacterium]|nr:hypothetical protein [Chloroflexota bacterium]
MRLYLFDVDETLECSGGPIKLNSLVVLRNEGHILGLCGNFAMVTLHIANWHHLFSLIGPMSMSKTDFMRNVRQHVPADDYIMVGNILGVSGASDDSGAAGEAGWRFIKESDFAQGAS